MPGRSGLFGSLEAHRDRLSALAWSLPDATLRRRPAPGAWSLAQLLDHVVRIDRGLDLDGGRLGRIAAATSRARGGLICAVLALPVRIPAPPGARAVMPSADPDPEATLEAWADLRSGWSERLGASTAEATVAYRHPIVGPLSVPDALAFLLAHHLHHDAQVRRTLAALGGADRQ